VTASVLERLVNTFDVVSLTMWAISLLSTIPERLLLFAICSAAIGLSVLAAKHRSQPALRVFLPVLTAFAVFVALYITFRFDAYPFPVDGYLFPGNHPIAVAFALALLVSIERSRFWRRPFASGVGKRRLLGGWMVTVIVIPAVAVTLLNGWSLRHLARRLHADEAVTRFADGDFNGLAIDTERGVLFASGHGSDSLLVYDLAALNKPPRRSPVAIGAAQAFAYNKRDDEVYVFNVKTQELLYLDGTTLRLKKVVQGLNVAPGDTWVDWEWSTDSILISSESEEDGVPTVIVARATGDVVDRIDLALANVLLHPRRPLYYMGFHERILAFDITRRQVVATFDPHANWFMERMAMAPGGQELLVAATAGSAILRFDPDTLELKGRIRTVLGVRTLAVDATRNLLLTASLVSNMFDVIDLRTQESVARHYLGPWLRTIVIDARHGVAYVSSIDGLFRVEYSSGIVQHN
jgi:DNA-binding beta-propeller fold protein YncE